jgi:hypothetical protein
MLDRLCPALLYAALRLLDLAELTWLGHCSTALRRRLDARDPNLRWFWQSVQPPHLLQAFNIAPFVVAKRIYRVYGLPTIVESDSSRVMHRACWGGLWYTSCVERMRWLLAIYKPWSDLSLAYDIERLNTLLYRVCRQGLLDAAQWYAQTFAPSPDDLRQWDAGRRHVGLVHEQWFPDRLAVLCDANRLAIVQWFVEQFEVTRAEALGVLRQAMFPSRTPTQTWLAARFGL